MDNIFYPYYFIFRKDGLFITDIDGDTVAGPYCGSIENVDNFKSESNFAGVYFKSDEDGVDAGFKIKYTCI